MASLVLIDLQFYFFYILDVGVIKKALAEYEVSLSALIQPLWEAFFNARFKWHVKVIYALTTEEKTCKTPRYLGMERTDSWWSRMTPPFFCLLLAQSSGDERGCKLHGTGWWTSSTGASVAGVAGPRSGDKSAQPEQPRTTPPGLHCRGEWTPLKDDTWLALIWV